MSTTPKRRGRFSKLTPQIQATICEGIREGLFFKHAAARAGVGESTFHQWMGQGRDAEAANEASIYRDFMEAVNAAKLDALQGHLTVIRTSDDWRAHAHMVAVHFPEYNPKNRVEVTGQGGGPVQVERSTRLAQAEDEDAILTALQADLADIKTMLEQAADEGP